MIKQAPPTVTRPAFYQTKFFQVTLGLLVSVGCLYLAVRPLLNQPGGLARVGIEFQHADYRTFPVILGVLAVFYWLKAWRWRLMLLPVGNYSPTKDLFGPIMIGFAFNNVLPARLGEFVRCYVFSRKKNLPLSITVSSVVLERIFDGMAVIFYLTIGLIFLKGIDPAVKQQALVLAVATGIVALSALVYVLRPQPFIAFTRAVFKKIPLIPQGLGEKVCRVLEGGAKGLSSLKNGRLLVLMLSISFVKWGLNASLFWLSLWSFDIHVSAPVVLALMGVVAIGVAAPQAPGYVGMMQLCFTSVLGLMDIPDEKSLAASVYYQFSQWIPVTLVGFLYFFTTGLTVQQIELEDEKAQPAPSPLPAIGKRNKRF